MNTTILDQTGTSTESARFSVDLEKIYLAKGSRLAFRILKESPMGFFYPLEVVEEFAPFDCELWDWWQYINIKLDREICNISTGKVQQGPLDFRFNIFPRRQAAFCHIVDAEFEPIYIDGPVDRERMFKKIGLLLMDDRPDCPFEQVVGFPRVTADGSNRIVKSGGRRYVKISPDVVVQELRNG